MNTSNNKKNYVPIISYGIINIDIIEDKFEKNYIKNFFSEKKKIIYNIYSKKYPDIKCSYVDNINFSNNTNNIQYDNITIPYDEINIEKFCYYKNKILFMMVSRKYSLGFIEFVRGKYDIFNKKSIINLFDQMYEEEINNIINNNYDDILYFFLNRNDETKETILNKIYEGKYSNEYCESKIKFNILKNPLENNYSTIDIYSYIKSKKPKWKNPEWGFPKGRKDNKNEENLICAIREFEEETGYNENEYYLLDKIEPLEEKLIGTNGFYYKHIYYLSLNNKNRNEKKNYYDKYEIGDVKWFTYDEAILNIRPYHIEKKNILTKIYLFILRHLMNYNY